MMQFYVQTAKLHTIACSLKQPMQTCILLQQSSSSFAMASYSPCKINATNHRRSLPPSLNCKQEAQQPNISATSAGPCQPAGSPEAGMNPLYIYRTWLPCESSKKKLLRHRECATAPAHLYNSALHPLRPESAAAPRSEALHLQNKPTQTASGSFGTHSTPDLPANSPSPGHTPSASHPNPHPPRPALNAISNPHLQHQHIPTARPLPQPVVLTCQLGPQRTEQRRARVSAPWIVLDAGPPIVLVVSPRTGCSTMMPERPLAIDRVTLPLRTGCPSPALVDSAAALLERAPLFFTPPVGANGGLAAGQPFASSGEAPAYRHRPQQPSFRFLADASILIILAAATLDSASSATLLHLSRSGTEQSMPCVKDLHDSSA